MMAKQKHQTNATKTINKHAVTHWSEDFEPES
jgi:hypothetical protein